MFTLQGLRQSPYCNIRSFAVDSKKNVHSMLKMLWSVSWSATLVQTEGQTRGGEVTCPWTNKKVQLKIYWLWPLFLHLFPYSFKIYLCSHYFIKFSVDEVFFCFLQAIKALKNNDNDIVNAIMVRPLAMWIFSIFFFTVRFCCMCLLHHGWEGCR